MFGVKFTLNFLLFGLPKPIGFPNTPFRKRDSHFLNERFLKSGARCMAFHVATIHTVVCVSGIWTFLRIVLHVH